MLFTEKDTDKYAHLFDVSHVILLCTVSEISPIAQITLRPLLSINIVLSYASHHISFHICYQTRIFILEDRY